MTTHRESSDHHSSIKLCSVESGMGENFLALEGLELNIPVRADNRQDGLATIWDDYFEEDITTLVNSSAAAQ